MYCPRCGSTMDVATKSCPNCGYRKKSIFSNRGFQMLSFALILCILLFGFVSFIASPTARFHQRTDHSLAFKSMISSEHAGMNETDSTPLEVAEIIRSSQSKIVTIFTKYRQGSGFIIDENGHVLTNAHVVQGDLVPVIRTTEGDEFFGRIIGYSDTTDIAVIYVEELVGMEPLPIEERDHAEIGDEVIALGSPKGYENTATFGNISGVDRSFIISPFEYDGIYQTSAPIAPGSSGGPLLSKKTGKAIAINSARDNTEVTISFSIPLYQVMPLVSEWIENPMLQDDVYALFHLEDETMYMEEYLERFGYYDEDYYGGEYRDGVHPEEEWIELWKEFWDSYSENEYMEEEWYWNKDYWEDELDAYLNWDDGWFSEDEYWEDEVP